MSIGRAAWTVAGLLAAGAISYGEIKMSQGALRSADAIRKHQPAERASGPQVHIVGKVAARELTRSNAGSECVAYAERASVVRQVSSSGKKKTEVVKVCRRQEQRPLAVRLASGEELELDPRRVPLSVTSFQPGGHPPPSCKEAPSTALWEEACLREGDTIDVMACRDGNRLVACRDGLDHAESPPPAKGPQAKLLGDTMLLLGFGALLLVGALLFPAAVAADGLVQLGKAERGPR